MDINLIKLFENFNSEDRCRELLESLRWPSGVCCLRCGNVSVSKLANRHQYECSGCRYQFSATAGSVFHDSHLPLWKWFLATYLVCEGKKGISAHQLHRTIGVSYKTAWYLCHRIRGAMSATERPLLDGTVEIDETYVGGHNKGSRRRAGFGDSNKQVVLGIRQRGGAVRFFHAEDAKTGTLQKFIEENISEDVDVIMTDEYRPYRKAVGKAKHETVTHSAGEYVRLGTDIHTNSVESAFSLLKRGIIGTWHRLSAKHLQAYLDEMSFRFDRRNRPDLFVDTLRHMVTADPLTFEKLTAA